MITGIDHIGIYVRDLARATADYAALLGRPADWEGTVGEHRHAWFQLSNMALDVIAPDTNGSEAQKTRDYIERHGEGIWGIGFAVADLERARSTLMRRGIEMFQPATGRSVNARGEIWEWRLAMARRASTGGLTQFLMEQGHGPPQTPTHHDDSVTGLDHIVINATNPDRALALYGARLGLNLRLDRTNEQWGSRLFFFRCGNLVVEIGVSLKQPVSDAPDRFGGLAFRVTAPAALRDRLAGQGFDVSELRKGRKPGTHVFTVRNRTANVPTLMIEQGAEATQ